MVEPLFFDDFVKDGEHFLDTFDEYFRLSFTAAEFKQITSKFGSEKVDPNTKLSQLMKKCFQLFATGLGERFEQIGYHFSDKSGGTLKIAERLKRKEKINVLIGFRVTQLWNNPLTVGPVANDPSAREFRTFWHGGSALRRFADSRVCECMVWGEEPSPAVVKTILRFLLIKNFGLTDEAVAWKSSFYDPTVVKKYNDEINTAFSSLSTALRSLKNLSLSVTNIHGVSPFLRGTEPQCELTKAAIGGKLQEGRYLPTSHLLPKFTPTVEVFIKMAYSTKWGDDVEAIKKLTAAFYLQIAEQLKTSHKLIAVPTEEHLYVVQDEIVFRLIIVNDKLQRLLEGRVNSLKENGASRIKATPEGRAHSSFQKKFVSELQLASSLHSFSLKSSFFSSTVQLFKLWLGAHQMSGILTDFATELLVAAALESKDKSEPGSSLCAFRRCLKLLAKHSWLSQPLFVNFDSQWTHEELDNLELNFIKMRPVLPPMVIITNEDHLGNKWTKDPSPQMLKRLVALATNSLRIIDEGLTKEAVVDLLGSVTQSTFKNYDLVLSCHRKMVTRAVEMVENGELKGLPVVDFDPVTDLVVALQNSLGSVALFFYNKYGSDKIAVKFKPIGEGVPAKMADIDELTNLMTESKVDPSALGQHPRFCQYKNVEKAAEQQADRRRDALERQRNRRLDAQNHMRNLAENLESDEEEETEEGEQTEAMDYSMKKERRRNRYDNELMTSEWLVDIPEKLSDDWIMVPSPVGRRVLVVATEGITTAYSKGGRLLHQFKSQLPCRSGRYTILDCILAGQTFYLLDILCWSGNVYYDFPFDNRRFFLQSHVEENPQLAVSTKSCKFVFKQLPACRCDTKEMEKMMNTEFDFGVDGLLFYHSQVLYVAGQSPLVGWLKPFMLPDVLRVNIPEKYFAANTEKLSADEYIEQFNKKHKHVSRIGKDQTDDEMSSSTR